MARDRIKELKAENEELRLRLEEAEGALEAIRTGQVESLVVEGPDGPRIFSLEGATHSYRVLVEAMTEGAATLAEDGAILYCNARLAAMLGAPLERVMGSTLQEWVPPALQAALRALLWEAREGESRGELAFREPGGRELPVHLSIKGFLDSGRSLLCIVATDLSEQRRNEEVLAEGRLARSVLEQAADAIVVCDEKGRITRASRTAEELCGCSPLRAYFDAAFPVVLTSPLLAGGLASTALRGAVTRAEPARLTRVDGSTAELLVSATPLHGPDDRVIGCVVTMVDVTEHRRAEQELRAAEERLRSLGDNLPDGALYRYAQDPSGRARYLYVSAGIEGLTGVRPAEILRNAAALHDTILPEDRERLAAAEARSRDTLTPFDLELRQRHRRTGEVRWALLRSVPRRLADGSTVWDGFHLDITARRHAEDGLRAADQNKNRFLATLSHELRNPLMPIRNALFMLERAGGSADRARQARRVIQRQVDQLARLVDDLLDVTRISRGKMRLRRDDLDFGDLVRRTIDDHRAAFDKAGVALQATLCSTELPMAADATRLAQVLENLLGNALKFTPRGGHVRVSLVPENEAAALEVRDDGSGIDAHMLTHLFEPFSQADLTLDRSHGGLGLGLSLVKGIVELHGGRIEAASAGPGQGAALTVRLPLATGPAARVPAPAAPEEAEPLAQRVLVIDDDLDSVDTLRSVLELFDHTVEVALSGPEALAKAATFRPDAVLCDLGLPEMDGYAVARAFRADPALRSVRLVALSGYAAPEDVARSLEAGFDQHLAKPPTVETLRRLFAGARRDETAEDPGPGLLH